MTKPMKDARAIAAPVAVKAQDPTRLEAKIVARSVAKVCEALAASGIPADAEYEFIYVRLLGIAARQPRFFTTPALSTLRNFYAFTQIATPPRKAKRHEK